MKRSLVLSCLLSLSAFDAACAATVEPFPLSATRLGDGPFKEAFDVNRTYLLETLDPDRLLAEFRAVAGLPPKGRRYGGWEACAITGHGLGHYLSGLSALVAVSDDPKAKARVDYIVDELALCQAKNGNGYVMTIPQDRVWNRIKKGEVKAGGFDILGWWVPNYTLHKVFAGLRDAYRYAGNTKALEVERKLGDWYLDVVGGLDARQLQTLLGSEWGGLNETFVQLYEDTGDRRYLDAAWDKFCHHRVFDGLLQGRDNLDGMHANTQAPKIVGLAALYQATKKPEYRTAVETFWDAVAETRAFATGGHSDHEHFYPVRDTVRKLGPQNGETCNVNNMIRLTGRIFTWDPTARRMDFVERGLINHLLANIGRKPGEFGYFISQCPVAEKVFSTPENAWWCCVCTGLENPQHYAEHAYYRSGDTLWVNLYHATTLNWAEKGLTLASTTRFPEEETVRYTVSAKKPVKLTFRFRHPAWCAKPVLKVNGADVATDSEPSSYFDVTRTWKTGDRIELVLPMTNRSEPLRHSDGRYAAFFHGPVLMAGITPPEAGKKDFAKVRWDDHLKAPSRTDEAAKMVVVKDRANVPYPTDRAMMPFYKVYEEHYTLYFPIVTEAEAAAERARLAEAARIEAEIRANTVDEVEPGFQQSEVEHAFVGEETSFGDHGDRKYRHAMGEKGWFAYTLKVDPKRRNELVCTWWGADRNRTFDILVDGTVLTEVKLEGRGGHQFVKAAYPIPAEMTRDKVSVKVTFRGKKGTWGTGGLFGLAVLRK